MHDPTSNQALLVLFAAADRQGYGASNDGHVGLRSSAGQTEQKSKALSTEMVERPPLCISRRYHVFQSIPNWKYARSVPSFWPQDDSGETMDPRKSRCLFRKVREGSASLLNERQALEVVPNFQEKGTSFNSSRYQEADPDRYQTFKALSSGMDR